MPVEQAFRRLQRSLRTAFPVQLILASRGDERPNLQRAVLNEELQQEFRFIAQENVDDELRLVPYTPGYKPDQGEICWVDLEGTPRVLELVQRSLHPIELPQFQHDDGFVHNLSFYALSARLGERRNAALFRKCGARIQLGQSRFIGAIFRAGTYNRMDERALLFDRSIDCFSDGRYVFINNVANFEKIFSYYEELRAAAEETVDTVLQHVPVSNAEAFREACTTQVRFMTKLAVIATKPYLGRLRLADLRRAVEEHQLDIEFIVEDGVEKLRFDPSPAQRWKILKLLDDDYLSSVMTHERYEVNSKIRLA